MTSSTPGRKLDPPPPEDVLYVQFTSARIPTKTRDGRKWDTIGGDAPDVFAKLIVDNKDVIVTPVQSNTLTPTWPDQVRANYRIRPGAQVRVELWDSNPINNHPVCAEKLRDLQIEAGTGRPLDIECESGAHVMLQVEPAHSRVGVGMTYELRSGEAYVTRVLSECPASRAGVQRGDQILRIQGQDVKTMEEGNVQSLINSNVSVGVKLALKHEDGKVVEVTVKDGPIYPLADEDIAVDQ
ncbi:MAG TPA: PDZ domain-containing protein [Polyangiaceae bacterium]|nr:PDZ domain-containing protein [Polyangiaceae bacterium]